MIEKDKLSFKSETMSPTFVTPPSSPIVAPDPQVGGQPTSPTETPTLPRRSTRVSRPPERLQYEKF